MGYAITVAFIVLIVDGMLEMKMTKLKQLIVFAIILTQVSLLKAEEADEKKAARRSQKQWHAVVSTWKEESLLLKNDGTDFKINTLNTVGRLGLTHYASGGKYFFRYGIVLGHSENDSAVDTIDYFQRSVLLAGLEGHVGLPFFLSSGVEMSLTLGGIYRMISHAVPSADYKFNTKAKFLPLIGLDYLWRLSQDWYWKQGVATQGKLNDTLWMAGLGYDW